MEKYIEMFLSDNINRGRSNATIIAYKRDLYTFLNFLYENKIEKIERINKTNIIAYLFELKKEGKSSSTMFRSLSSLRGFFKFLCLKSIIPLDPTQGVEVPKTEQKAPDILSVEEVEKIITSIPLNNNKGIRDRAMLELMYATGIRVTEIIKLSLNDINLELKFVNINSGKNIRFVPFNDSCYEYLKKYLEEVRDNLKADNNTDILFLNVNGSNISRQGFWKIIKAYAKNIGINKAITPQTFRHCFAAHLIKNGVDGEDLIELLGTKDISSLQIYKNLKEKRIMDIYRNLHPRK